MRRSGRCEQRTRRAAGLFHCSRNARPQKALVGRAQFVPAPATRLWDPPWHEEKRAGKERDARTVGHPTPSSRYMRALKGCRQENKIGKRGVPNLRA